MEPFIPDQDELDGEITSRFLIPHDTMEGADVQSVDPETQARLEALLEAAGETGCSVKSKTRLLSL